MASIHGPHDVNSIKQSFGLVSLEPVAVSRNQMGGCSWWLLQGNLSKSFKSSEFQG